MISGHKTQSLITVISIIKQYNCVRELDYSFPQKQKTSTHLKTCIHSIIFKARKKIWLRVSSIPLPDSILHNALHQ